MIRNVLYITIAIAGLVGCATAPQHPEQPVRKRPIRSFASASDPMPKGPRWKIMANLPPGKPIKYGIEYCAEGHDENKDLSVGRANAESNAILALSQVLVGADPDKVKQMPHDSDWWVHANESMFDLIFCVVPTKGQLTHWTVPSYTPDPFAALMAAEEAAKPAPQPLVPNAAEEPANAATAQNAEGQGNENEAAAASAPESKPAPAKPARGKKRRSTSKDPFEELPRSASPQPQPTALAVAEPAPAAAPPAPPVMPAAIEPPPQAPTATPEPSLKRIPISDERNAISKIWAEADKQEKGTSFLHKGQWCSTGSVEISDQNQKGLGIDFAAKLAGTNIFRSLNMAGIAFPSVAAVLERTSQRYSRSRPDDHSVDTLVCVRIDDHVATN